MYRGLYFKHQNLYNLRSYVDADWGNCPNTCRSHTGFLVLRHEHLVSWKSTKQATVLLASTEAEYKALADSCKDIVWLQNLSTEILDIKEPLSTIVHVDNRGAIDLALSQVSQNGFRTKHMDLRLHFIRDLIAQKLIKISYISTHKNISDFLTKPVGRLNISRAVATFACNAQTLSALCSQAPSMPGCQNTGFSADVDADTIMLSLSKSQPLCMKSDHLNGN
jgi:hypothetical protein